MRTGTMKTAMSLLMLVALNTAALAGQGEPTDVVKGATEQLQAQIGAHRNEYRANPAAFHRAIESTVAPAFDLGYTSQLVLGKYWRTATPEQRARFQAAFAKTLVTTYGDALLEREGATQIRWMLSTIDAFERSAAVRAQIAMADGAPPASLLFAMRLDDANQWRAYDVSIEGVSLI